ncbi:glycosyltransferase family 1 protein [Kerstersia gyiorum]|uniref:glycosyltransferase family 4 protein n=1 Tax=Kerstersia gyiorum TaxID=206506 RepID=UPI0010715A55|nr:glycosyltransferase family 4 protein [Kerstersia gyiorum]QBR40820.1 glycosyltransferase family 1 protein [Kerstersia gyiorum]
MNVIYLLPRDGYGGAEHAARSLLSDESQALTVAYMCRNAEKPEEAGAVCISPNATFDSIGMYWNAILYVIKQKPDVLICSLWRASFVGLIYIVFSCLFRFRRPIFVVFAHSAKFSNIFDRLINGVAHCVAAEIWCDSKGTRDSLIALRHRTKAKVLSFFVPALDLGIMGTGVSFVYWGRLSAVKRLDLSIAVFEKVASRCPDVCFYIFGPDEGVLDGIIEHVKTNGLSKRVFYLGVKPIGIYPKEISQCGFFLNLSDREGMAISVIEAMTVGLVPVVTPVGEVANYCVDGFNSIVFSDIDKTVGAIVDLVEKEGERMRLATNAIKTWEGRESFKADFSKNVERIGKTNF